MGKQPDFLFIVTDPQRADHLGCYGNRTVRTPRIDSLAARGVRAGLTERLARAMTERHARAMTERHARAMIDAAETSPCPTPVA